MYERTLLVILPLERANVHARRTGMVNGDFIHGEELVASVSQYRLLHRRKGVNRPLTHQLDVGNACAISLSITA